jgi:divalent metal cation (Fe/Co/Zn/Cd) transporter
MSIAPQSIAFGYSQSTRICLKPLDNLGSMEVRTLPLPAAPPDSLLRRARFLARLGLAWHAVEAAIAIGAGIAASSIALIGFGADSLVESAAGVILLWRLGGRRAHSEQAEQRAQRLIGLTFWVIAAYVGIEAIRSLVGGDEPSVSYLGIGLAAVTLVTMPPLAAAKARVAHQLGSAATRSEGRQNLLCAYLSAALLVGLGANAAFGWWWADPATALLIAGVAVNEGREAWRGEGCADDCC